MDVKNVIQKIPERIRRYRYPVIVVLLGLVLLCVPNLDKKQSLEATQVQDTQQPDDISAELAQILSHIKGVGKVKVMLTICAGEQTVYQTDDTTSDTSVRKQTVIITNSDRAQQPLITQVLPPDYLGAIVVCQGGDNAQVRLAIVDAVSKVTGLGADRISVLKMK